MSIRFTPATSAAILSGILALPAVAQQATETLQEVTITGSRIIVNGNDAPTPVTVVTLDEMQATKPTTVFEQLAELPAFNGSGGATATPTNGIIAVSSSGVASLNLRGLGALRELVLFDGHRLPPSTLDGVVDINLMPQMLMQRVDVVTGGASAVYGSDAVSGVINFIVDRKFSGIKANLQGGQSSRNDDRAFQVGIAGGTNLFGGRGHIEASFQRTKDNGLENYLTRPGIYDWTLEGDGKAVPYHQVQGATLTNQTFGGLVTYFGPGPFKNYTFDQNGVLTPLAVGPRTGLNNNHMLGGGGAINTVPALKATTRLDQFFARLDYDLRDNLHAWANASAAVDFTSAFSNPSLTFFMALSGCNPYLSTAIQQGFGCTNPSSVQQQTDSTFLFNKFPDPRTNALKATLTSTYLRNYSFMGGLEGKLGNDYHWDATYTFSETKQDTRADGIDEDPHWFAAVDAVRNPANGQIVCRVTLTNPNLMPGCVPINMFGPTAESQAAVDYSFGRVSRWTTTRLNGLTANLRGAPFNNWVGPVGMALSGEFRRQTLELHSNSYADQVDCSFDTVLGNCTPSGDGATHTWGNTFSPLSQVQQSTAEGALEANLPLLKGAPLVQALSLDSAVRYTRYSNAGIGASSNINATTWKAGLIWNLNDQVTVRATRSRDIRAPNLWDLFNPVAATASSFGSTDYLTNNDRSQLAPQQSGGNPNLKPERALTSTLGIVWRPTSNFNLAVDAYSISLSDAIIFATGSSRPYQEACYASGGSSVYCGLQTRALGSYTNTSAANYVVRWFNQNINIGSIKTNGIDFETNYHSSIAARAFSLRTLVAYKPHIIYSQSAVKPIDQAGAAAYAGYGGLSAQPVWRAEAFVGFDLFQNFAANLSERWRSHLRYQGDRDLLEVGGGVPSYYSTNLNLTYTVPTPHGQLSMYLNMQNLFDKAPPPLGTLNGPGDPGSYVGGDDPVGRYYILGLRARL